METSRNRRPHRPLLLFALSAALGASVALLTAPSLRGAAPGAASASVTAGKDAARVHKLIVGTPTPLKAPPGREVATLAGGCFWAMQTEFERLKGVDKVVAGYAGGTVANPSYEQVCSESTGHAETIQITFDPAVLSYTDLLRIYFTDIDPTTLNRQGPDSGDNYRSAVFYHSARQRDAAEQVIREITARRLYKDPIVTEVVPYKSFYRAEDYHQDYYVHNPDQPYCREVVSHELSRFRQMNAARLKT